MKDDESPVKWGVILSKSEYARYRKAEFGKGSPALVTKWLNAGRLAPPALLPDGKIDRLVADEMLFAGVSEAAEPIAPAPTAELTQARTRTEHLKNRKLEIEIGRLEGDLVEADTVEVALFSCARRFRDRLDALPAVLAGRLVGKTEAEIKTMLGEAIRAACAEFTDDLMRETKSAQRESQNHALAERTEPGSDRPGDGAGTRAE